MGADLSAGTLLTGCEIFKGKKASEKNTKAVMQIYDAIKTSYGPLGLDKICLDATGNITVTNDGATILKNMLVSDASARILVNLALEQDSEVGDGTTSVVLIACNLISKGNELIQQGIHPSIVVSGYRMAFSESLKYIKNNIARKIAVNSQLFTEKSILDSIIETSISSKIINQEKSLFIEIIKKSLMNVQKEGIFNVDKVKILKSLGGSLADTSFINGHIVNCSIASKMMVQHAENVKVACIEFSLLLDKLPLTAAIQVDNPEKLEAIRKEEIELTKKKCRAIIDSGAKLVLSTGGIDEMCIKMFIDNGICAIRRCEKADLANLAAALGTDLKESIVSLENEYKVEGLGFCQKYEIKAIGDFDRLFISGCPENLSTILIHAPNSTIADEAERSLNDALQVSKRALESKSVVPGGGAVEAALMFLLEEFSSKINCKEHVAIHRYADSLLEIPRILASNAGLDANKIVSELLSTQLKVFKEGKTDLFLGLDVMKETIQDNFSNGILEPTTYKLKALKAATEAAIGVLRINETIVFPNSN